MTLTDILSGGPWVIAVGVAWLVFTGKLRLGREFEELEEQFDRLTESHKLATTLLNDTQAKERDALRTSLAAAEQRTAEIGSRLDRLIEQRAGRS